MKKTKKEKPVKEKVEKVKVSSKLANFNKFLAVVLALVFIADMVLIIADPFASETTSADNGPKFAEDVPVIDEFKAGTYGGVEFTSVDDVLAYYTEAYNNTKSQTAEYTNVTDGSVSTLYKFLGTEKLDVSEVLVDGNKNDMINKLVPGIVSNIFKPSTWSLVPSVEKNPEADKTDEYDYTKCMLQADDILAANVVDNGDGTITISIQPKGADMAEKGKDSQGRFFMALGDIAGVVDAIGIVTWAEGDTASNVQVRYQGGTGIIKIDTATKEVVEADYEMKANVLVQHANVTVLKDKSASLDISYKNHFPASDEYLKEHNNIVRK